MHLDAAFFALVAPGIFLGVVDYAPAASDHGLRASTPAPSVSARTSARRTAPPKEAKALLAE